MGTANANNAALRSRESHNHNCYVFYINQFYATGTFDVFRGNRRRQKQPPRGVLRKRFPENMQQIFRRTPMPKCDVNKVEILSSALLKSHFSMGVLL